MKYSIDIDEKSLFRGIKNDFKSGHSATTSTPLNQSKDKAKWRNDIYTFLNACQSEDVSKIPDRLKDLCLRQTTSKAPTKLVNFYVFSNFAVDGVPFEAEASFAMCIKEETAGEISKRDSKTGTNTHIGRQMLHYQVSLNYTTDGYNINNGIVLKRIIDVNGGFAYVVKGFDYDTDTKVLNFRTTLVGLEGVSLSNVFKSKKGIGKKLLVDDIKLNNLDIDKKLVEKLLPEEERNSFYTTLEKIQESCRSNGILGEKYVLEKLDDILGKKIQKKIKNKSHISDKYPQSPYDIECDMEDGEKMYIEVKSTKDAKKIFYMSKGERNFMDLKEQNYLLILVTKVNTDKKKTFSYFRKEIMNSDIMEQENQSIKFIVRT